MTPSDPSVATAASNQQGPYPISLNTDQETAIKDWAADDRLWTTQETVEFNLRTFARVVLARIKEEPKPSSEARDQSSSSELVGVNTETELRRALSPGSLSPDLLRGLIEKWRKEARTVLTYQYRVKPRVAPTLDRCADELASLLVLGSAKVALSPDLLREIEDACAALMHMEIRINSGIADDADGAGCCTARSLLRRLAALLGSPHE